jgi:hypothetical protein
MSFFTLDNALPICVGAWAVICPAALALKHYLGYKAPQVFRTTEFKRKFKKHQMQFNEEFKQNKLFK